MLFHQLCHVVIADETSNDAAKLLSYTKKIVFSEKFFTKSHVQLKKTTDLLTS